MYREPKDVRNAIITSIADLVINFAMMVTVTGVIQIPPLIICIVYGLYSGVILIAGFFAIIALVALLTKFKEELKKDIKRGKDGYEREAITKPPLHNCLVIRGMALTACLISIFVVAINITSGKILPMYQIMFAIYIGLYIVLNGISLILSKAMNYHSTYQWIINLPNNNRNSKLVQEYKDTIDAMRLEGNIWRGELAKERKKIDNYFYNILQ